MVDTTPLTDPVEEGARVAVAATRDGVCVRVIGGVAVAMRCPSARRPPLAREYGDIDLVTVSREVDETKRLLRGLGYEPDEGFNMLHGHTRLLFWDTPNQRQVDVFVDKADLCHSFDFRKRISMAEGTLPLADLLVLKLQIMETNTKDLLDICALLTDYEISHDEAGINGSYLAALAGADWGLWRTLGIVLDRVGVFARELEGQASRAIIEKRLFQLRELLDAAPKTRGWKMRARIGDRKRWYSLPEEVG